MFTAWVMYMTKTITAVYGHCIDTSQTCTTLDTRTDLCTLYTMLTIVRGCTRPLMLTSEHTLMEIYPYMVIFRRYTASVSYWLVPMYMTKTITSVYGHCIDTSQTSATLDTQC